MTVQSLLLLLLVETLITRGQNVVESDVCGPGQFYLDLRWASNVQKGTPMITLLVRTSKATTK